MRVLADALDHDPGDLRARAGDLLSRPPYREEPAGPLAEAWLRVREWVAELLGRVVGLVAGDTTLAWVVVALGLAVLLVVVWRATRGLAMDRAVELPSIGPQGRPASAWHADADEHELAGRWREAVRCRYRALVGHLVEDGIVEDVPGRTVGELDRELQTAAPGMAAEMARAGEVFATLIYGDLPAREEHARTLAEVARGLRRRGIRA